MSLLNAGHDEIVGWNIEVPQTHLLEDRFGEPLTRFPACQRFLLNGLYPEDAGRFTVCVDLFNRRIFIFSFDGDDSGVTGTIVVDREFCDKGHSILFFVIQGWSVFKSNRFRPLFHPFIFYQTKRPRPKVGREDLF